jgi:hypothetical protein
MKISRILASPLQRRWDDDAEPGIGTLTPRRSASAEGSSVEWRRPGGARRIREDQRKERNRKELRIEKERNTLTFFRLAAKPHRKRKEHAYVLQAAFLVEEHKHIFLCFLESFLADIYKLYTSIFKLRNIF